MSSRKGRISSAVWILACWLSRDITGRQSCDDGGQMLIERVLGLAPDVAVGVIECYQLSSSGN